jgi:OmpA-OmpF porin, OOP family
MKIRTIALAGVAALALSGPAAASDATGWYLGLGAGWDHMGQFSQVFTPQIPPNPPGTADVIFKTGTDDTALIVGSFGYRFANHIRIENEIGYDKHDLNDPLFDGHSGITSDLININWDIPLSDRWDMTLGVGAGVGREDLLTTHTPFTYEDGKQRGYMYQFIGGFAYSVTHNVDLYVDYRYRNLSVHKDFDTSFTTWDATAKNLNEQAAMVGIRWYLESAPPPPPPPPPPLPPPPPPPPVKTFIVFFDFNKSNLTAEAQSVVTEAVKTAKSTGMVKVMVTGHTDTVGSDSYNQGLSVRRAQSVKDEMVRQGMDGGSIAIEGKSFHDPLVPTGPGVREPQNRRAVIDLGS